MKSRPGIIVIAAISVALAACSVAPAAKVPTASKAPAAAPAPVAAEATAAPGFEFKYLYGTYRVQVPVATPAPDEDVQSLHWTYMKRSATAAASASTSGSRSPLTSRPDGRAPAAAISTASGEDFQSLHATYNHLAR